MKYLFLVVSALFAQLGAFEAVVNEGDAGNPISVGKDYGIIIPVKNYKLVANIFRENGEKIEVYRHIKKPSHEFFFDASYLKGVPYDLNNICMWWDGGLYNRCFKSGKSGEIPIISIFSPGDNTSTLSFTMENGTESFSLTFAIDKFDTIGIDYWNQFFEEVAKGIEFCNPTVNAVGYFYNNDTEMFHHQYSGLSFKVPEGFEVEIDPEHLEKYLGKFSALNGEIELDISWSLEPVSFQSKYEEEYAFSLENIETDEFRYSDTIEKITLGNALQAFRVRSVATSKSTGKTSFVVNEFHFFNEGYSFKLTCYSKLTQEKELLKAMEETLQSISFDR